LLAQNISCAFNISSSVLPLCLILFRFFSPIANVSSLPSLHFSESWRPREPIRRLFHRSASLSTLCATLPL
jgi:hypothetical protein